MEGVHGNGLPPSVWLPAVERIAVAAGAAILELYQTDVEVKSKSDGSPLTVADQRANALIVAGLAALTPAIPVLSEESAEIDYAVRAGWRRLWLVDPLDGTREFIRRNGEFTVNVALIDAGRPVLGVVYTPVTGVIHAGAAGLGAYRRVGGETQAITTRPYYGEAAAVMVASRSHAGPATETYRGRLAARVGRVDIDSMGSSLKICLVAEGRADIYPRLGPTSEWDTAAAHGVLNAAGGALTDTAGAPLAYNKVSLLNPWFLAMGDPRYDWAGLARGIEVR